MLRKLHADRSKIWATGQSRGADGLRNIALTAPYMHDGSLATLEAVIDHYASGGRGHPHQHARVRPLPLTAQNRRDLVAFLESLTGAELAGDPRFANPW